MKCCCSEGLSLLNRCADCCCVAFLFFFSLSLFLSILCDVPSEEFILFSVVVLRQGAENYRNLCREKRFVVRPFKFDPAEDKAERERKETLAGKKKKLWVRARFLGETDRERERERGGETGRNCICSRQQSMEAAALQRLAPALDPR